MAFVSEPDERKRRQRSQVMDAVETDVLLALRAGRLFNGERSFGPSMVLISGGRVVDGDITSVTLPPQRPRGRLE